MIDFSDTQNPKSNINNLLKTDQTYLTQHIIQKYINLGYNSLKPEELAFTLIIPSFTNDFKKKTGENWSQKYSIKTLNKLKTENISLNFLNTNTHNKNFKNFFLAVQNGDLTSLKTFYKKYNFSELKDITNSSGKTALHIAAKQGNLPIIEYLLDNGNSLNTRDRLFRTPLMISCLYGQSVICEYIIRNDLSTLLSKDLRGRSAIHFASCSPTVDCVNIIFLYNKKIIFDRDYFGRTVLHYSVLNHSLEQIEFLRIFVKEKIDVNLTDDEGRTVFHYMASSGVLRGFSFLLENGGDLAVKDNNNKSAIEICKNNNIRESIIVLSTPKHVLNLEDQRKLNRGVIGQKVVFSGKENLEINSKKNKINLENGIVPSFLQNSFYDIMKRLQKNGIESYQHIRKPYLFTGSWFEGIKNLEELFEKIKNLNSNETMIRTFNMICPYEEDLPKKNGERFISDNFYGYCYDFDKVTDNNNNHNFFKTCNCEDKKKGAERIIFENMIKKRELEIINLKENMAYLKDEITNLKNNKIFDKEKNFEKKNYEEMLESRNVEIKHLKKNIDIIKYSNMTLKKNLEKSDFDKKTKQKKINNLKKTIEVLNDSIEELNHDIEGYKNGDKITKSTKAIIKTIKIEKKRNFDKKRINFEQEQAFSQLTKNLKTSDLILKNEITKFDKDSDGKLSRYEFTNFLQNYLKNVRLYNLIDFFELNKKYNDIYIKDFLEVFNQRILIREKKEKELFFIVLKEMKKIGLNPFNFEKKFDFANYDQDKSLDLDLMEFKGFLFDLGIDQILDQDLKRLFDYLDENGNGKIDVKEFKKKLETVDFLWDLQNNKIKKKEENKNILISKKFQLKKKKK